MIFNKVNDSVRKIISSSFTLFIVVSCFILFSCENDVDANRVRFSDKDTVEHTATSAILKIYSDTEWTVSGIAEDGEDDWFELSRERGRGYGDVTVNFSQNKGDLRTALISVDFGGSYKTIRLAQREYFDESTQILKDWFELPAGYDEEGDDISLIFHYVPEKREMRSYTVRYNTEWHYPEWVAYPMHQSYMGGAGRDNIWRWDPKIPASLQANMTHAMQNGFDRGHMLPSASRTISKVANDQTFYCTNMCAQEKALNGGVWANLEARVRGWSGAHKTTDTLFVVTGAVLQRADVDNEKFDVTYSRNDKSKPIAVPNYYYKALVKLKSGSTPKYEGVAFWFNRKDTYREVSVDDIISIEELESRTGLTFFPQLPDGDVARVKGDPNLDFWGF